VRLRFTADRRVLEQRAAPSQVAAPAGRLVCCRIPVVLIVGSVRAWGFRPSITLLLDAAGGAVTVHMQRPRCPLRAESRKSHHRRASER